MHKVVVLIIFSLNNKRKYIFKCFTFRCHQLQGKLLALQSVGNISDSHLTLHVTGSRGRERKNTKIPPPPPKVLNIKCKVVSQYCSVPPYPSTYSMPAPPEHLFRASTPPGRHCSCGLGAPGLGNAAYSPTCLESKANKAQLSLSSHLKQLVSTPNPNVLPHCEKSTFFKADRSYKLV